MATLSEIRAQHPEYNDLSDAQLADGLYRKFYSDLPREEFDAKVGLQPKGEDRGALDATARGVANFVPFIDEIAGGIGGGLASLAQQVAYKNALGRGSGGATPPPAAGPGSSTYIQQRQAGNPYGAGGGMPHQPGTGGAPWSGGGVPPEPPYGTPEWYVWNARYGRLAG